LGVAQDGDILCYAILGWAFELKIE